MGLPVVDFIVNIDIHNLQATAVDEGGQLRIGGHGRHQFLTGAATGVAENQQRIFGPDAIEGLPAAFRVDEDKVRSRGADAVEGAHPRIPAVTGAIGVIRKGRSRLTLNPGQIEVLAAHRGIGVVEVLAHPFGQTREHLPVAVTEGFGLGKEAIHDGDSLGKRGHFQECYECTELFLSRFRTYSVQGEGIREEYLGGIQVTVPEVGCHPGDALVRIRIDDGHLNRGETAHLGSLGSAGAGPASEGQHTEGGENNPAPYFKKNIHWKYLKGQN